MSEPTPAAWLALKRIGRYLIGARRILQTFKWGEISGHIEGYGDSDWAGDKVSRRSTSGGALIWNGDVLKTWSVRQKTIALCIAEAELYAMTKCATQTLGMIQLMQDFNIVLKGVVHTDSSAALGIVSRVGIGGTRHIQVQYLWLQERLLKNDLRAVKIGGKFNVCDIMTKYLKREDIDNILHIMGMQVHDSQSCIASIQYNSFDTGEGVDYWIRTQKELWPGSDVDKPQVTEVRPRTTLFHPLYHSQGPSLARHVPRMRISAFVDGSNNKYSVFVDDWRCSPKEVNMTQRTYTGWTAFVYQLPDALEFLF